MAGSEFDSPGAVAPQTEIPDAPAVPAVPAQELPPAVQRFQSCRWRQAPDSGVPEHCTHRDVQPMAGTTGFDATAWCPDCEYYKVRRTPRKRPPQTYQDSRYY